MRWYIFMVAVARASPARLALKKVLGSDVMVVARVAIEVATEVVAPPRIDKAVVVVGDVRGVVFGMGKVWGVRVVWWWCCHWEEEGRGRVACDGVKASVRGMPFIDVDRTIVSKTALVTIVLPDNDIVIVFVILRLLTRLYDSHLDSDTVHVLTLKEPEQRR